MIPYPRKEFIAYGSDVTISDIKSAMQKGFDQGHVKFYDVSSFESIETYEDDEFGVFTDDSDDEGILLIW